MRDDGPPVFYVTILIEKFSWKIWKTHLFKRFSQTKHHVDVDTRYRPDVRSIWISVIFLRILVIFLLTSKNYSPKSPKLKRTQAFFFFVLIFVRWKRATSAGKWSRQLIRIEESPASSFSLVQPASDQHLPNNFWDLVFLILRLPLLSNPCIISCPITIPIPP